MNNLVQVESVTGDEFINPEQITHVSPMRDSVVMHFTDQSMVVLMHPEWNRIRPMLVVPQSPLEASADDLKPSTSPILVDQDDPDQSSEPPMLFADVQDDPDDDEIEMFPAVETDLQALIRLVRRGNYVILDTETTGLDHRAEICSIAIIDDTGKILLDTLVKPVRGIPADATRIHGITNDMVKDVRGWLNLNGQVWDLLYGRDVIVYNADYDFRLLNQSEKACDPFAVSDWSTISRVCAMNAYAEHVGDWNDYHDNYRWHKLTDAASAAGFHLPEGMKPHSAIADCHMTLAVCRYLAELDGTI